MYVMLDAIFIQGRKKCYATYILKYGKAKRQHPENTAQTHLAATVQEVMKGSEGRIKTHLFLVSCGRDKVKDLKRRTTVRYIYRV